MDDSWCSVITSSSSSSDDEDNSKELLADMILEMDIGRPVVKSLKVQVNNYVLHVVTFLVISTVSQNLKHTNPFKGSTHYKV